MSSISKLYALTSAACLAIALAAVGNAFAQEQSDQDQNAQSDQDQASQSDQQRDQSRTQSSDDQNQQSASQSDSQNAQQAQQNQQREQKERQRQQQSQQRDQQSPDRDQSSWNDSDTPRDRQWPQPNDRDYGSDPLRYRSDQQSSRDSDSFSRRSALSSRPMGDAQRSVSNQGGLGVSLRSDGREGVIVSQVHDGSPAEEMGIRQNDRITAVNGRLIQSVQQFIARIRNMQPGEQIELDIRRARGGEQTVRGELESRNEALVDNSQQGQLSDQQRGNWQTSYEGERGESSQNRSGQASNNRLDQIERQVDRLSREIDQLRVALQSIRHGSGQTSEWNRERTARYEEYEAAPGQRPTDERWDGRNTYRQAERERSSDFRRDRDAGESRDRFDVGRGGGETGEERLHIGAENLRRD